MGNQVTFFGGNGKIMSDVSIGMQEYESTSGNVWVINSGLVTGLATPNYHWISFLTPSTGYNVLIGWDISKTGDDLQTQFISGPTITGTPGSTVTTANFNQVINKACPFTVQASLSSAATLSGGAVLDGMYLGGLSQGNYSAANAQTTGEIVVLKNSTLYAVKVTALATATKFMGRIILGNIPA